MWNFPKGMSNISDTMSDNNRVNSIDYEMAATYLLNYLYCFLGWFFFVSSKLVSLSKYRFVYSKRYASILRTIALKISYFQRRSTGLFHEGPPEN